MNLRHQPVRRLAMSVLHCRTSNYISELGLCRPSNLFFSRLLCLQCRAKLNMGVSENSVPLNPMVNDHYPY